MLEQESEGASSRAEKHAFFIAWNTPPFLANSTRLKRYSRSSPHAGQKTKPWTPAEIAQLGNVPDCQLGQRTGRTIKAVVAETGSARHWTADSAPAMDRARDSAPWAVLGFGSGAAALPTGCSDVQPATVIGAIKARRDGMALMKDGTPGRRWSAEEDQLIGTQPDRDIAARLGCPLIAVVTRRRQLRIPRLAHHPG